MVSFKFGSTTKGSGAKCLKDILMDTFHNIVLDIDICDSLKRFLTILEIPEDFPKSFRNIPEIHNSFL